MYDAYVSSGSHFIKSLSQIDPSMNGSRGPLSSIYIYLDASKLMPLKQAVSQSPQMQ